MNHTLPILVYLVTALVVTKIPYLRVYLSLCNTLLHELIRVILEGRIKNKIKLHNEGMRRITNMEGSRLNNTLITYAGYTGESLAAIGLFYFVSNQNYHVILYLFIGLMSIAILLWIRNFWGFIWAMSFVILLALPIYFSYDLAIVHIGIFLASIILIQSIMNGIKVCRQIFLKRKNPAKVGFFARVKLIPSMLFGVVLFGQSLYTGYFIGKNILSLY